MLRRRGFTLIELLVVIAIIGILAAMLFPVFARARESARKTQCLANVKNIAMAFQMYFTDYDRLPPGEHDAASARVLRGQGLRHGPRMLQLPDAGEPLPALAGHPGRVHQEPRHLALPERAELQRSRAGQRKLEYWNPSGEGQLEPTASARSGSPTGWGGNTTDTSPGGWLSGAHPGRRQRWLGDWTCCTAQCRRH